MAWFSHGGGGIYMRRVAMYVLNKQKQTTDKGLSSAWRLDDGLKRPWREEL